MKRKRILLWSLVAAVLAFSSVDIGLAFQNEPEGFRGLKWGDPPTKEMRFIRCDKYGQSLYDLPDEKLQIGDAEILHVTYCFFNDRDVEKLMRVFVYFEGENNFKILETICNAKFDKPSQEEYQKLIWASPKTIVILSYDRSYGKLGDGILLLDYVPISDAYHKAKEQKQVEEAEKDW